MRRHVPIGVPRERRERSQPQKPAGQASPWQQFEGVRHRIGALVPAAVGPHELKRPFRTRARNAGPQKGTVILKRKSLDTLRAVPAPHATHQGVTEVTGPVVNQQVRCVPEVVHAETYAAGRETRTSKQTIGTGAPAFRATAPGATLFTGSCRTGGTRPNQPVLLSFIEQG